MYFRNKISQKRNIKIWVKSSRFVNSINFESRLIIIIITLFILGLKIYIYNNKLEKTINNKLIYINKLKPLIKKDLVRDLPQIL